MRTVLSRLVRHAGRGVRRRSSWLLVALLAVVSALGLHAADLALGAADPARIESIAGRVEGHSVAVLIQSSEPVPYVTGQPDPLTVVVEMRNARSAGVANRFAAAAQDAVVGVTVEDGLATDGVPIARVYVRLARATTSRVKSDRNVIRVEVDGNGEPDPAPPAGDGPATSLRTAQEAAVPAAAPPNPLAGQRTGERQYTGAPISLDFSGADIRTVLRSFVDFSGLNIIIDPKVQGTVDIALRDVPWDQALDIILKSNGLDYSVDGTVVRIASIDTLKEEDQKRRERAEEQARGTTLDTLTHTLSYATAEDMKNILVRSRAVTAQGMVETDKRTNTIIVRDLPASMATVREIITTLDRPQPQVEIEARIVQTTRSFARQIGVQWGFAGRLDPALGNTTPLAFPNQGSIGGRTGAVGGNVPSAVNLPTTNAAFGAIGLSMGSVNGAFNLDVALSALEKTGQGRILSSPRVLAQNNYVAKMMQGVQIPIQTVANNTITVQFKDAALQLEVTPQITANNTVIMKIVVENASPDYTKQVNNIPPINTQKADTQVLIKDNNTIVIGGIYTSREQTQNDRTPALHRIPLLGWLFRRDIIDEEANELLIFITPRIVKG